MRKRNLDRLDTVALALVILALVTVVCLTVLMVKTPPVPP